ncbi:MAG: hypothetical protein ABI972_23720 [Acidobacteriota bacterium]
MRQPPEFFEDEELDLVYIGKKLRHSRRVEALLDEAGVEYAIEVDYYVGGLLFRSQRAGAFFYVRAGAFEQAAAALSVAGFEPMTRPEADAAEKSS